MAVEGCFSVVTPSYNMAGFLAETIESVLVNLEPGDEYYVIDGGSADGSAEIIGRYRTKLSGWLSEPDNGYAEALVKGFQRCSGEYFCWINSGDLLLKGALRQARQELNRTCSDLIFGDDIYIDEKSRVIFHSSGYTASLKDMMLYGGWAPLQDACFWRRALYERVGGIDPSLKFAADYDFFLKASIYGKCTHVPKTFSAFRRHEGQTSIRNVWGYEHERGMCRRRMIDKLGIDAFERMRMRIYYGFLVRWRHHILRRFHRAKVKEGSAVRDLAV